MSFIKEGIIKEIENLRCSYKKRMELKYGELNFNEGYKDKMENITSLTEVFVIKKVSNECKKFENLSDLKPTTLSLIYTLLVEKKFYVKKTITTSNGIKSTVKIRLK